ncbi:hypothetical protein ACFXHL_53735, partial [Streptomyces mirabilis]
SSPYDPDARYATKRGSGWCGYKTHLSETCEPHAPHLITHVVTTDATVADTEVTAVVHQGLATRERLPEEHDVDAGYVTAAHIVAAREAHGIELLGPAGLDTCHENYEGEHFTQSAFTIDWEAKKAVCPQGKISASSAQDPPRTHLRRHRHQHHQTRRLAQRNTPRRNPHLTPRPTPTRPLTTRSHPPVYAFPNGVVNAREEALLNTALPRTGAWVCTIGLSRDVSGSRCTP